MEVTYYHRPPIFRDTILHDTAHNTLNSEVIIRSYEDPMTVTLRPSGRDKDVSYDKNIDRDIYALYCRNPLRCFIKFCKRNMIKILISLGHDTAIYHDMGRHTDLIEDFMAVGC